MDTQTLQIILTFLAAQIAALLAFFKWKEEIKVQIGNNAARSQAERAALYEMVKSILVEMKILPPAPPPDPASSPATFIDHSQSKELQ